MTSSIINSFRHFRASKIFPLFFLLLSLSGFGSAQNLDLQEMVSLSIQLNTKTIQASSLEDQLFPMLLTNKISTIDPSSPAARNPVDLVWVFGTEAKAPLAIIIREIRNLVKDLLALMTEQDRLAVVLFHNPSFADNLVDVIDTLPIEKLPSLISTSNQNWENIILTAGKKVIPEGLESDRALKAAMKILNQRNETNRTTGVFISTSKKYVEEDRRVDGIEWQDKNWIIRTFHGNSDENAFTYGLAGLRAGVIETKFLLKPEESDLLKGVTIQGIYPGFPSGKWSFAEEDGTFSLRTPSFKPGLQEEFFFDLKIPKITQDLPSAPLEVKVASYQVIFVLEDGSQVVKSQDLTVKIVREGEKIVEEEESKEAVRSFYRKWAEDWMWEKAASRKAVMSDHEAAKKILKEYKESLDGSIVKDDEMLQNMWKGIKRMIAPDEDGVEY